MMQFFNRRCKRKLVKFLLTVSFNAVQFQTMYKEINLSSLTFYMSESVVTILHIFYKDSQLVSDEVNIINSKNCQKECLLILLLVFILFLPGWNFCFFRKELRFLFAVYQMKGGWSIGYAS